MKHLVVVRGAGELASGVIHCLHRAGLRVIILETAQPTSTRRRVSFADAMYRGEATVERLTCHLAKTVEEAKKRVKKGELIMLCDPECKSLAELKPAVVVDAIVSHEDHGTNKAMAEHTVALGPGFCAGRDVDVVVETMRGHNLGRLIYEGYSYRDSRGGGEVGVSSHLAHIVFAPATGKIKFHCTISRGIKKGEPLATIEAKDGTKVEVAATIDGVLRGAIMNGLKVKKGQKIADIHPSMTSEECFTISDKARCIGGSVLTAVMAWESQATKKSKFPFNHFGFDKD